MIALPVIGTSPSTGFGQYFQPPAISRRADTFDRPWPALEAGTGGEVLPALVEQPYGYDPFFVVREPRTAPPAQFAKLMEQVKEGFGRTMSRLPVVFGVSRQTLYNWRAGEKTPKEEHQARLRQLAEAASVFTEMGFTPTSAMLSRSLADGKTFLQLMAEGASGNETAKRLIRVVQRGQDSRARLDALLGGRKADLDSSDFGAPAMDENA